MTPETTPEWTSYYEAVDGREPRELLIEALDALGDVGSAIDLGCGDGTETETRETLDAFAGALRRAAAEARATPDLLHDAPVTTPVRRLDEARAARHLKLRWD